MVDRILKMLGYTATIAFFVIVIAWCITCLLDPTSSAIHMTAIMILFLSLFGALVSVNVAIAYIMELAHVPKKVKQQGS